MGGGNSLLVAIVLAAGMGRRFGGDKMAARLAGRSLLDHALDTARASPADRIVLVARPDMPAPHDERITSVSLASRAISDSLRAGVAAAGKAEGAFIFLGDMPLVPPDLAGRLAAAIGDAPAAQPMWQGSPGHPVLLARRAFPLVNELSGDEGLGTVLRHLDSVVRLPVVEQGAVLDVDAVSDLMAISARIRP